MKKETPHSEKSGAGLANGLNDDGARCGMPTMGRDQRQKRSPKERSAVSGTVNKVSQVALDHLGSSHHQVGHSDGSAPASKIVKARDRPGQIGGGWSSYAFARALSNQQVWFNNYGLRFYRREKMKNGIFA